MAGVLLDEGLRDRERLAEGLRDRERLAKVEGRLEESHRHVATREDVQAVRIELVGFIQHAQDFSRSAIHGIV